MGRRSETTEYLAECISDALIELMRVTPIEKIKVQEIADLAKVGRMTYFRYFNSKEDVLLYKLSLLWKRWADEHPLSVDSNNYDQALWFFTFCDSIKDFLSILLNQNLFGVLFNIFQAIMLPIENESGKTHYQALYTTYGMLGVIAGWVQSGCQETPKELADSCVK